MILARSVVVAGEEDTARARARGGRDVVEHVGIPRGQWEARESAESAKL